jgi:hypothetical protein
MIGKYMVETGKDTAEDFTASSATWPGNVTYTRTPFKRITCPLGCSPEMHCIVRHAVAEHPEVGSWNISCSCPACSPRC